MCPRNTWILKHPGVCIYVCVYVCVSRTSQSVWWWTPEQIVGRSLVFSCSQFGIALVLLAEHSPTLTTSCHLSAVRVQPSFIKLQSNIRNMPENTVPMSSTRCLAVCCRECQYFQYLSCSSRFLSSLNTTMITLWAQEEKDSNESQGLMICHVTPSLRRHSWLNGNYSRKSH